jgi:hypothetical protein
MIVKSCPNPFARNRRAAIPAPQYRSAFANVTAPRDSASWNLSAPDHHWLVRQQPPTQEHEVTAGDEHFRNSKRAWPPMRS